MRAARTAGDPRDTAKSSLPRAKPAREVPSHTRQPKPARERRRRPWPQPAAPKPGPGARLRAARHERRPARTRKPTSGAGRPTPGWASSVEPADAQNASTGSACPRIVEEEIPAGPNCFGPRIWPSQSLKASCYPGTLPKCDGTTKPKDWLLDYTTTVGISRGNKRRAVRYSPSC
nr:uncharacterized protein LOC127322802 [Lolium perenne]